MSETAAGYVLDVASNGDLTLSLPPGMTAEVGERFTVLDNQGRSVAEIKVVRADSSGTIARFFQPFVSDDELSKATGTTGAGAAAGSVIGTLLAPGIGAAVGMALGALVGSALRRRRPRQPIIRGMAVIPITGSNENATVEG